MGKRGSCQGVLESEELAKKLGAECEYLHQLLKDERFSHGDNFEKLHTGKRRQVVYSLRLNQEKRVLLTKHELDGHCYWVLLDYLEHHEYERTPFLKQKGYLKKYLAQESTVAGLRDSMRKQGFTVSSGLGLGGSSTSSTTERASTAGAGAGLGLGGTSSSIGASTSSFFGAGLGLGGTSSESSSAAKEEPSGEVSLQELHFFNRELIVLNPEQEKALALAEPMLVTGMPGSGKSCVAMTYLTECLQRMKDASKERPLLYVTESELLAKSMRDTFRASPLGKTLPAGQVQFLSYGELMLREYPKLGALKRVVKSDFVTWFKEVYDDKTTGFEKELGTKAAELIYQEMRMMSAYNEKDYARLGERESPLFNKSSLVKPGGKKTPSFGAGAGAGEKESDNQSRTARRAAIFALKARYEKYLEDNKLYDTSFLKLDIKAQYSHIAGDEAQDFSTLQLDMLRRMAVKNHNEQPGIAFFADTNQSVVDNFPKLNFFKNNLGIKNLGELPGTFRCSDAVRKLANGILGIKYHVTGGILEKGGQSFITSNENAPAGNAYWVPESQDKQTEGLKEHLTALTATPHCVVITPEDQVTHAKARFPGAIVLTPKQAKGLEYDTVILFRMLDRPFYQGMNKYLADYKPISAGTTIHRAKSGEAQYEYNAPLNELFTAITRARKTVYILQDEPLHRIRHLISHVKAAVPTADIAPEAVSVPEGSTAAWENAIRQLIDRGHLDQATELADAHLGMSEEEFGRKFLGLEEKKEALKEGKKEEKRPAQVPPLEQKEAKRGKKAAQAPVETEKGTKETIRLHRKRLPAAVPKARASVSKAPELDTMYLARLINGADDSKLDSLIILEATIDNFLKKDDFATYLFCIDMGNKESLFEGLSQKKSNLLLKSIKRNPAEILKKIPWEVLCAPRQWFFVSHASPLDIFAFLESGVEFLDLFLRHNPEFLKSDLLAKAFYTPLSKEARELENQTVLHSLCRSERGLDLLKRIVHPLFSFAPEAFVKALCLSRTAAAKDEENRSALLWLCTNTGSLAVLEMLIKCNRNVFATEAVASALCLPLPYTTGPCENMSVIFGLCNHSKGLAILNTLIDANQELFLTEAFVKTLCLPLTQDTGSFQNNSGLFLLCRESTGQKLLRKLVASSPILFATNEVTTAIIRLATTEKNINGLMLLQRSDEGLALLDEIAKINSSLREELTKQSQDNLVSGASRHLLFPAASESSSSKDAVGEIAAAAP